MVPVWMLNQARRDLADALLEQLSRPPSRNIDIASGRDLLANIDAEGSAKETPKLVVLCRTLDQLQAAVETDVDLVYVDFHDVRQYGDAVEIAHASGKKIAIATVRMQKPGEMGLARVLLRHTPDQILARNLAAIRFFQDEGIPTIADFSLNVANHRSAEWIRSLGVDRVTASYDLNRDQLSDLVRAVPSDWMEVVIHQHMPMFHMEHCVFCAVISPGTNKTNCGRPCDRHVVQLRDRVGAEHTLQADVACRNTLYNAAPQSGAETVDELRQAGVNWFRIELLEQDTAQVHETIRVYQQLLGGQMSPREVWQILNATNRVGVTRGTLESKRNPLAIL